MNNISEIILKAGEILKERYCHSFKYSSKGRYDLQTEVDVEVENLIIDRLKKMRPEAGVFSEESGEVTANSELRWILDPIDGTANFVFGVPHFCISLCLEKNGAIVEAYVYNPISNEFYFSSENEGKSFLNGSDIQVSETSKIEDSLVVFGFSANFKNISLYHDRWPKIFNESKKGIGMLSPALNICNVARGRIDCFVDFGSSMEGHAGAALVLKNAGGKITNYDLSEWNHKCEGIVAANGSKLFSEIAINAAMDNR